MTAENKAPTQQDEKIIHVYDDIREADNDLPQWWLITFFGTIIFGLGYWFVFHEFRTSPLPMEAYAEELERTAPKGGPVSAEFLVALSNDPDDVEIGHAVFTTNCVVCHEAQGQGKIGPNLTDGVWIRGGAPEQIFETVAKGSLTAGMPGWEAVLGRHKTEQVVAYVLTLRGKNVPGKEPQGEPWPPAGDTSAADAAVAPAPSNPSAPSVAPTAAPTPTPAPAPAPADAPAPQ